MTKKYVYFVSYAALNDTTQLLFNDEIILDKEINTMDEIEKTQEAIVNKLNTNFGLSIRNVRVINFILLREESSDDDVPRNNNDFPREEESE